MKKYPFDKQEESKDCGAACLSMIIKFYGGYLSMEKIREIININRDGTTAYHIIEGAKEIGFNAIGCKCELENFEKEKVVYPVIANVIINKSYTHFVVIYNVNYKKRELIIADPADKVKKISFDSFNLIYNGIILILYPREKITFTEPTKITWNDFYPLIKNNRSFFINIFFLSLFIIIYSIILSFYSQTMLDSISVINNENYLFCLFFIFGIFTFIKATSEYFRNIIFTYVTQKIELIMTMDFFEKILSLPYGYYRNHHSGDVLTRLKDVSIIRDTFSRWIMVIIVDIPLMIISFIILYFISAKLALVSLLIFILYWLVLKMFHSPLEQVIEKCHKDNSILTSNQIEAINAFETIKGINISKQVISEVEKKECSFLNSLQKFQKMSLLESYLKELVEAIGCLFIFYVGSCLVYNEQITFGLLLTFQSLVSYFLTPIRELVDLDADTKNMKKAIIRLKEIIITDDHKGYVSETLDGNIVFKNLYYTYNKTYNVLNNINLTIYKGQKVLLIGQSGSGKSTLLKLLKRYYSVARDCITVGNYDLNDYKNTNDILYLNQTEFLFTESMYANITFNEKIDNRKVSEIFKICEVDKIAKKSNLGYFSLIEENGFNLSGGEKQRIVLARTLLRPFNILIIDEGLSQVDINMERRILKNIFYKFYNKTIIVISHRLDNADLFNRMIRMNKGKIVEDVLKNG